MKEMVVLINLRVRESFHMRLGSKLRFWVVEMTCLFIRLCVRKLFILYLRCWDLYVVTTISWQNRSTSYNQSHIFLLQ